MYFAFKKSLIDSLAILDNIQEKKLFAALNKISELKQGRVYILYAMGARLEEIELIRSILNQVQKRLDWTMPEIIVSNKDISELKLEEVEKILQKFNEVNKD